MDVLIDDTELAPRRKHGRRGARHRAGRIVQIMPEVGQAPGGAVTIRGAADWPSVRLMRKNIKIQGREVNGFYTKPDLTSLADQEERELNCRWPAADP